MRINHNIAALNTYNKLNSATNAQSKSMEKLSSGLRINSAADDAAGLAISEKMRGQIRGLDQAAKNAQDGISLIQTAEGALSETTDILQRMRELATQASNDTNTETDRGEIQKEMNSLTSEINRIGNTTEFNTQKLLNGEKTTETTATAAKVNGTATVAAAVAGDAGNLVFSVDGGANKTATIAAADTLTDIVGKINTAAGSTIASAVDGKLVLTSSSTGSDSSIKIDASTTDATASYLGLSETTTKGTAAGAGLQFQIGANENQSLTLEISDMRAVALGIATKGNTNSDLAVTDGTNNTATETALDVSTAATASAAITTIQTAIDTVSAERSKLGANQNRLDHTINNLSTSSENLTAAESRIRDVDMAKEMMAQTKNSILSQAAQAMLAQSNQLPQGVLQLLQ
ncbi:flagellin [Niallia sp.]|uniref:flagellin N-terminal helical domain-containing protein n=1 Tax=Niallia sp. TaxID=2837523 RepID=UPI0028966242|nr:flagellin [Niallia sp.]